jgi:hypothetical protein
MYTSQVFGLNFLKINYIQIKKIIPDGVLIIVLAAGTNVPVFKPGRGRWVFNGKKVRSTTFFWRESKTVIRFYGMLKIPEEYGTDISPAN